MIEHIEQNIFVNKLFLLLNISDFSLISIKKTAGDAKRLARKMDHQKTWG